MRLKFLKIVVFTILLGCIPTKSYSQFTDGITGLLHMVNAEVQKDATFMLGGNMLHQNNIPSKYWWGDYNTYNYYLNFTFLDRIEIAYICTLVQGKKNGFHWPEYTYGKFVNQDRHFAGKIQLVKEGEWWKHMPAIAVGVSDPTTGGGNDYSNMNVNGDGNGFFNRWFVAMSKHFNIKNAGELGVHATYLYNKRTDYPLNGPAFGINFRPEFHRNLNLIAEYDAKTINIGALYSLWADHFNFLFELQEGKYISAGLVYKVNLKGGNNWKSKIFE